MLAPVQAAVIPIADRHAEYANAVADALREAGLRPRFEVLRAPSRGIGTAVVLVAECDEVVAGFGALGRRGKPAEQVAEEACRECDPRGASFVNINSPREPKASSRGGVEP